MWGKSPRGGGRGEGEYNGGYNGGKCKGENDQGRKGSGVLAGEKWGERGVGEVTE